MSQNELQSEDEYEKLVLETFRSQCSMAGKHQALQAVALALKNPPNELVCQRISGGQCNKAYKIYLKNSPSLAFFAKLSFPYALWNVNNPYSSARTEHEFFMMQRFQELMGDNAPVPTPYFVCSLENDRKLLVTEWVPGVSLADLLARGQASPTIMETLAQAFATLHLATFEPDFNNLVRPYVTSQFPQVCYQWKQLLQGDTTDPCLERGRTVGYNEFDRCMNACAMEFESCRDCLCHNDSHAFNIIATDDDTNVYICDWEMSFAGPLGRDVGVFQAWPIACALCFAGKGDRATALELWETTKLFWNTFAKILCDKGNKHETYLISVLKSSMRWNACMLVGIYYILGLFLEKLPMHNLPESCQQSIKSGIGMVGLELLLHSNRGDVNDESLESLLQYYNQLVTGMIDSISGTS